MSFITEPFQRFTEWAIHPHKKYVYGFHEGSIEDRELLGNKGANLCEMTRIGLPVPPGIVVSTEACLDYFRETRHLPDHLVEEYIKGVHEIEKKTGMFFGGQTKEHEQMKMVSNTFPLLLSVRSGAAVSMPGMMDTVLNLGMNDQVLSIITNLTNARFAYDTYRRFLNMYGNVVLGIDNTLYEDVLTQARKNRNVEHDSQLLVDDLVKVVEEFKQIASVPQDPWDQLRAALESVFCSWYNPRAVTYRDINNISSNLGTAVTIQAMVYGNYNERSGSGVAFTRNPGTGENVFYGEYLSNAEGEDVVAGIRTPVSLDELRKMMPSVYDNLVQIEMILEKHYRDMQDIEFTVQNGNLYILQTRSGKRTPRAAVRIAVSMVQENLITEREALLRLDAEQMNFFMHPMIDPLLFGTALGGLSDKVIAKGLPASAGAAIGVIVFNCKDATELSKTGVRTILCREQTSPDDIGGLQSSDGVLTSRGGLTSHAAIVMRNMGKTAVVGARNITIDCQKEELICGVNRDIVLHKGDIITLDGSSGFIYRGEIPTVAAGTDEDFRTIIRWAEKYKSLKVFANAESFEDAKKASQLRAEGIGLCRTEHMFFKSDRLDLMRGFILSDSLSARCQYLSKILPLHTKDFEQILRLFPGKPVTVRLLDPPLHEFLPTTKSATFAQEVQEIANRLGIDPAQCERRIRELQETNPMLGFRGCRVSILYPELTDMQVRAVMDASTHLYAEGVSSAVQIMIPLVCTDHEIECITPTIKSTVQSVCENAGYAVDYKVGCMLEVPRALLRANAIVNNSEIDFISIGTNDLTQLMYGFSRDDAGRFLPVYMEKHIFASDPFKSIDERGVGEMIRIAINKIQSSNPKTKISVCGEHAGDPQSIRFFNHIGVDCISCSAYRIPVAKVAAAQAHILSLQHKTPYSPVLFPLAPWM